MRKPLIAGNWKMNMGGRNCENLARGIKELPEDSSCVDILICPPYTSLIMVNEIIKDSPIMLGAQNCFYELRGAYTGEISPRFLIDMGCEYVILGHSERRKYSGETPELIGMKLGCAIDSGLNTILCVGEELKEREEGRASLVVESQLEGSLKELSEHHLGRITVAYEPVWAIGTGKTCDPDMADEMHGFIRTWFKRRFSEKAGEDLRILYGGSIKPDNISSLVEKEEIDGGLVGGASLISESFLEIIEKTAEVTSCE